MAFTERDTIKRRKRNDKYTTANEPLIGYQQNDEIITQYPDMYQAYMDFANTYAISTDNFILTNGTEDSLRICFSVIRRLYDEYMRVYYMDHGWGLVNILAEQEGFYPKKIETSISNYTQEFVNIDYFDLKERVYYYAPISNVFKQCIDEKRILSASKENMIIRDEVYTNETLLQACTYLNPGVFVIGSYSKALGCGIRLGYILFNSSYNEYFQHNRPNYISPLAAMHTKIRLPSYEQRMEHMRELEEERDEYFGKGFTTPNYITIKSEEYDGDTERINRTICTKDGKFVRLGMMK